MGRCACARALPLDCGDRPGDVPNRDDAGGEPIGPKPRSLDRFARCTGRDSGSGDRPRSDSVVEVSKMDCAALATAGVRGESLPLELIIVVAIPEGDEPAAVALVERDDGRNADRADCGELTPAATAAAKLVVIPEARRDRGSVEDWGKAESCSELSEATVDTVGAALPIIIGGREEIESEDGRTGVDPPLLGCVPIPADFEKEPSRLS